MPPAPELDLREIFADRQAPRPSQTQRPPFKRPPLKPKPELHGYRPMPIENSRKFVGTIGAIALVGLIALIANWYTDKVHELEKMGRKAGDGHNAKIRDYAAPKGIAVKPKPSRAPAVASGPSKVVPPQSEPPQYVVSTSTKIERAAYQTAEPRSAPTQTPTVQVFKVLFDIYSGTAATKPDREPEGTQQKIKRPAGDNSPKAGHRASRRNQSENGSGRVTLR